MGPEMLEKMGFVFETARLKKINVVIITMKPIGAEKGKGGCF